MKLIEIAETQLGVHERAERDNRGVEVEKYLASVGLKGGYSWCMAFVYWCANESAKSQTGKINPLVKTAGVMAQWNTVNKKYKFKTFPQVGDIFIMDFGRGLGHTGIVISVQSDTITTIEGNSNDEGSREGYEVCKRTRKISTCVGFVRTWL